MKKSVFYFLAIFLTGCATNSTSYNPEKMPESNLATIIFEKLAFLEMGTKFQGSISAVFDNNGNKIIDSQSAEVKLPSG